MPDILSKENKFDPVLVTELFDKVKGKSSLAALCDQAPIPFNGQKEFIFTMDDEVDLVAENGKMTRGSVSLDPVIIVPVKIEYGARISDEFLYAAEEEQIETLRNFSDGFAKRLQEVLTLWLFTELIREPRQLLHLSVQITLTTA